MTEQAWMAWANLRHTLAEATALGAQFQISGADVVIGGLDSLPADLAQALAVRQADGVLWHYLGARALEAPALAMAKTLGVAARVVETVPETRAAVRQLMRDAQCYGGHIALDLETAPLPGHGRPQPPAKLNPGQERSNRARPAPGAGCAGAIIRWGHHVLHLPRPSAEPGVGLALAPPAAAGGA
jgi:hypothetical protein